MNHIFTSSEIDKRFRIIVFLPPFLAILLVCRLFYLQVIKGPELQAKASKQHELITFLKPKRGDIVDKDGNVLAGTKNLYSLFVYKPELKISQSDLINQLIENLNPPSDGSSEADLKVYLLNRLSLASNWISLKHYLSPEEKTRIETKEIKGIGFEDEFVRYYPESSMSAHLLGFVGQDIAGQEQGYFGLEGYFDRRLRGRSGKIRAEKDARGNPILIGNYLFLESVEGKQINTTVDKKTQYLSEKLLAEGLSKYQAQSGSVVIMETKTGKIRAMASLPSYDPAKFSQYPSDYYNNPVVSDLFEPGSIFKVLIMAAGLNEKVVSPDTQCDICAGPVSIGKYLIKTWDETYRANSTMTDVIVHSDNTGMVFVARKLGAEKFVDYLKKYGLGQKTDIEQQEEVAGSIRAVKDYKDIDLATNSFGQGIAVTAIQMVSAVNTIANNGYYVSPTLIESSSLPVQRSVLAPEAVNKMTTIMVEAVEQGEAKWARPKNLTVAGKTGTAQIPIEGHYDATKTIASFVGFFPAENPKYTMLVTLKEPKTSPWGSETAAPLWFALAKQLLL